MQRTSFNLHPGRSSLALCVCVRRRPLGGELCMGPCSDGLLMPLSIQMRLLCILCPCLCPFVIERAICQGVKGTAMLPRGATIQPLPLFMGCAKRRRPASPLLGLPWCKPGPGGRSCPAHDNDDPSRNTKFD
jgi:hypothetical protein